MQQSDEQGDADKISTATVARYFKDTGVINTRERYKPTLSPEQREARVQWCEENKKNDWIYWAAMDEKHVDLQSKAIRVKRRKLHAPNATAMEFKRVQHVRHMPKVTIITVIGKPDPDRNFDGKIFMSRVTATKTAERSSKNHAKGDKYQIYVTLNSDRYYKIMVEHILLRQW